MECGEAHSRVFVQGCFRQEIHRATFLCPDKATKAGDAQVTGLGLAVEFPVGSHRLGSLASLEKGVGNAQSGILESPLERSIVFKLESLQRGDLTQTPESADAGKLEIAPALLSAEQTRDFLRRRPVAALSPGC